jgi:O-antigen ligase
MLKNNHKISVSNFWLIAWAIGLSLCWLLPNHYLPWSAFHMNAWCGILMLIMAMYWLVFTRNTIPLIVIVITVLAFIPILQKLLGLIDYWGMAALAGMHLLAFACAMLLGYRWESSKPHQAADGLFLAIGIASIFSVGLQLHQWLDLDRLQIWSMGNGSGRPYGNFGQPNQLGTLLIWSLIGLAWGVYRRFIGKNVAFFAAVFILFGLALTASRTAWIGVGILSASVIYWREFFASRRDIYVCLALAVIFAVFAIAVPFISQNLLSHKLIEELDPAIRLSAEMRPKIWMHLLNAIWEKPWFGYGWGNVVDAQIEVAASNPPLYVLFSDAHNIIINMLLWCGVPIGVLILAAVAGWFWRVFAGIKKGEMALLFLFLVIVGNHALLEYPLSYAYFLLPIGLVVGVLSRNSLVAISGDRLFSVVLVFLLASSLSIVIRDYARVERSYEVLRFEWAKIQTNAKREAPEVLVLDQLRDLILLARFEPSRNMNSEQLTWMVKVAGHYPSPGVVHKLSAALAWNGQANEGKLWLDKMCAVSPKEQCQLVNQALLEQSKSDPEIALLIGR